MRDAFSADRWLRAPCSITSPPESSLESNRHEPRRITAVDDTIDAFTANDSGDRALVVIRLELVCRKVVMGHRDLFVRQQKVLWWDAVLAHQGSNDPRSA